MAIGAEVEECFLHCAKAFKRSELWRPDGWPERAVFGGAEILLVTHRCAHSSYFRRLRAQPYERGSTNEAAEKRAHRPNLADTLTPWPILLLANILLLVGARRARHRDNPTLGSAA